MKDETARYPVDLQVHSTCSDGTAAPGDLVAQAASLGIRVLALTDHDTAQGVDAAAAAGRQHGVWILPALEFSTKSDAALDLLDINILGYGIDPHHAQLTAVLQAVVASRVEQKIRQIERLQSYGVDVPVDEVLARAGGVPGRLHIAQVALERNPQRFVSLQDVFDEYLAPDAPRSTYVARTYSLTVEEAIAVSHAAGGIAVLAHPGSYTRIQDVDGAVRRMRAMGLDGIEVSYTYAQNRGHRGASPAQVARVIARFRRLAVELALVQTGGSDYHGTVKPGIALGMAGLTLFEWSALAEAQGWGWDA